MLKTVDYRGGVICFRIPSDWTEEYEDEGGGTFYGPGEHAGTLRVEITTGEGKDGEPVTIDRLTKLFADDSAKYGVASKLLGDNVAMIRYDMPAVERGQPLMLRCWRIFQALPPKNFRHVLFTYTQLADQFDHPTSRAGMELLDREILAVEFAPTLGVLASSKKPWWRMW